MSRSWSGLLTSYMVASLLFIFPSAHAHETGSLPSTTFSISNVNLISKGPFQPGDLVFFDLITDLPKDQFHFIQIAGECLTYAAEWHEGNERSFINNERTKLGQAVAVISSGCTDGEHAIQEVLLVAKDNTYSRITGESANLPRYVTTNGHFVSDPPRTKLNDSIDLSSLSKSLKLSRNGMVKILTLPRITENGQTISWTAIGNCKITREHGLNDLGGQVTTNKPGKCSLSANTPWGSNLFKPVNIAREVSVYSKNAIPCQKNGSNLIYYTEKAKCPKGYVKR
jgi:hypothetical protein